MFTICFSDKFELGGFLTLATGTARSCTELKLFTPSKNGSSIECSIVWEQPSLCSHDYLRSTPGLVILKQLIPCPADQTKLLDMFERWVKLCRVMERPRDLFLGIRYNPGMYLEQRFLSLVFTLEAIYRTRYSCLELSQIDHRKIVKEIIDSSPPAHRKWLSRKLVFSNQVAFQTNLEKVVSELAGMAIVTEAIGNDVVFFRNAKNTRNYQVHQLNNLEKKRLRGTELHRMNQVLELIVEAWFLKELGFDAVSAERQLRRKWRHILKAAGSGLIF